MYLLQKSLPVVCVAPDCLWNWQHVMWLVTEMIFTLSQAIAHFWMLEAVFRAVMHAVENTLISGLIEFRLSHYIKEDCSRLNMGLDY